MITKHTPTPWKAAKSPCIDKGRENEWEIHWSDDGECVAEVVHGEYAAKFIVRACNAHDELVAALEKFIEAVSDTEMLAKDEQWFINELENARHALREARGEA